MRSYLAGYATVHGTTDADCSAVLIIRHKAVPMIMGSTPAFFTSNMSWSALPVRKRHEKVSQPCHAMFAMMTANTPRMNSVVRATINALSSVRSPENIAAKRGKSVEDILG